MSLVLSFQDTWLIDSERRIISVSGIYYQDVNQTTSSLESDGLATGAT